MFTKAERRLINLLLSLDNPTVGKLAAVMYADRLAPPSYKNRVTSVLICKLRKKLSANNVILSRGKPHHPFLTIDKPERLREIIA